MNQICLLTTMRKERTMAKRNDMNALVARLVNPSATNRADEAGTEIEPTTAPDIHTPRQYRRKPESNPRNEISAKLISELQLTPEMVRAINKIRERDRYARERDTRGSVCYGLKEGYKRHTFLINSAQLESIKEIAKAQNITLYELIESIIYQFLLGYDHNK